MIDAFTEGATQTFAAFMSESAPKSLNLEVGSCFFTRETPISSRFYLTAMSFFSPLTFCIIQVVQQANSYPGHSH